MNEIVFSCRDCGERLCATEDMVGQSTHCPACGREILIPARSERAPVPEGGMRRLILQLAVLLGICVGAAFGFKALSGLNKETPTAAPAAAVADAESVAGTSPAAQPEAAVVDDDVASPAVPAETKAERLQVWDRIRPGLARDDVLMLLGRPNVRLHKDKREFLFYEQGEITLIDGKVVYCRRTAH